MLSNALTFFRFGYFLLLLVFTGAKAGDSVDYALVKDLKDEWLIYDKEYNSYFPIVTSNITNVKAASQLVDLHRYKDYQLHFKSTAGLTVFIENELVYESKAGKSTIVNLPIFNLPQANGNELEEITFYNPNGHLPFQEFKIIKPGFHSTQLKPYLASIFPRTVNNLGTLYTVYFLVIVSSIAIIKNRFSKRFNEFLGVSSLIPTWEENPIWDITSVPVLILLLINSFCASLVLFVIKREFDLDSLSSLNIFAHQAVIGVLVVGLIIFIIYLLKYFQLKIIGWIFNLNELVKIQFFELMKVSLKVNLFLTIVIMFFYSSGYFSLEINFQYFLYFVIFTLLIVLFRVSYLAFAHSRFRNIYLFSYLCATEVLPLAIIVKLILF